MFLTLDQIDTYLSCPDEYMYAYDLNLKTNKVDGREKFDEAVHKTLYHYFYSLMDHKKLTEGEMRRKFNELWFRPQDKLEFLFSNNDSDVQASLEAVSFFNVFHRLESRNPGVPLEINRDVNVMIDDHIVAVHIDLVREITLKGKSVVQLIDFKTNRRMPDQFFLDDDLHMTLMSYAYRTINHKKEDQLIYYMLKNGQQLPANRGETNYQRMKRLVNMVADGIENKRFYPRVSYKCKTCPFQEICKRWPHEFEGAE